MQELKSLVNQLFEQDQHLRALEKELKTKTAQYNHLLMKNIEKAYSDAEVLTINSIFTELQALQQRQQELQANCNHVKDQLKQIILPLNGGRWIHTTDDIMHPNWEFWLEGEELQYAKLNGQRY